MERARQRGILDDERHRIACELHDVTAQHLAAVALRNRTAERLGDTDELRTVVGFAGTAVEQSRRSMKQIVSMLRDGDGQEPPQPRLSDLDAVVENAGQSGLDVRLTVGSAVDQVLDRPTELAVVRICQEAVTNAVRHGGPATATATIVLDGGDVVVTVDDGGPGGRSESADPTTATSGHGLIGMRERARACGGSLTIGRSALGGWRVEARIPVPASEPEQP